MLSVECSAMLASESRSGSLPYEREPLLPEQRLRDEALLVPDVRGRVHGK